MMLHVTTCANGSCATDDYMAQDGMLGGPGDVVSISVELDGHASCVYAQSARLCDRDGKPVFSPLGESAASPAP